jgi:hypothetical protein
MTERPNTRTVEKTRQSRSAALIVLGVLMFVMLAMASVTNTEGMGAGAIVLGLLGVALVVAGLVVRRR